MVRGRELSEKQIDSFNNLLKEEGFLETNPVTLEVTNSTESPFSDKLILFTVVSTTSSAIGLIGRSLGLSMRRDIAAKYTNILKDIMLFVEDGTNIMIDRGWFEQPPQASKKN